MDTNLEAKRKWRQKRREMRLNDSYYLNRMRDAHFSAWYVGGTILLTTIILLFVWMGVAK